MLASLTFITISLDSCKESTLKSNELKLVNDSGFP